MWCSFNTVNDLEPLVGLTLLSVLTSTFARPDAQRWAAKYLALMWFEGYSMVDEKPQVDVITSDSESSTLMIVASRVQIDFRSIADDEQMFVLNGLKVMMGFLNDASG